MRLMNIKVVYGRDPGSGRPRGKYVCMYVDMVSPQARFVSRLGGRRLPEKDLSQPEGCTRGR